VTSLTSAQDFEVQSDALAVFGQLKSVAEELAAEFGVGRGQRLALNVESQHKKTVTENAFLEVLKDRGALVYLATGVGNAEDSVLRVVVLVQEAKRHELEDGVAVRYVETMMDARIETRSGVVPAQKIFHRVSTDTLRVRSWSTDASFLERLLEPAIVIGGAILVVFLLFTVRSS